MFLILNSLCRRFSPYTYALNNPVYFIDPDGMEAEAPVDNSGTLEKDDYENKIDMGYGKMVDADKVSGAVDSTAGTSKLTEKGRKKFEAAGIKDAMSNMMQFENNDSNSHDTKNETEGQQKPQTTFQDGLMKVLKNAKVGKEITADDLVEIYGVPKDAVVLIKSFKKIDSNSVYVDWVGSFNGKMILANTLSSAIFKDGVINVTPLKDGRLKLTGDGIGIKYKGKSYYTLFLTGDFARIPQATKEWKFKIGL